LYVNKYDIPFSFNTLNNSKRFVKQTINPRKPVFQRPSTIHTFVQSRKSWICAMILSAWNFNMSKVSFDRAMLHFLGLSNLLRTLRMSLNVWQNSVVSSRCWNRLGTHSWQNMCCTHVLRVCAATLIRDLWYIMCFFFSFVTHSKPSFFCNFCRNTILFQKISFSLY